MTNLFWIKMKHLCHYIWLVKQNFTVLCLFSSSLIYCYLLFVVFIIKICAPVSFKIISYKLKPPKRSKVLISGVSFHQRSLSQSQESDVLSYSEHKIATNFQGFAPGPHWWWLTALPQTPRLHNGFSPRYACRKTGSPKKLLDTALYLVFSWIKNV